MFKTSISAAVLLSAGVAVASPCTEGSLPLEQQTLCLSADALFNERGDLYTSKDKTREERAAKANEAIDIYKSVLGSATGADRAYIASKIARSYIYVGDALIPKSDKTVRRDYFKNCQAFVEDEMAPAKIGSENLQPYYYLLASCWAFKLEMSNVLVQLREKGQVEKLVYEGTKSSLGNDYLGGGIYRSLSGIRSSRAAIAIGAGDVVEAVEAVEAALETPENSLFNDKPIAGKDFCGNYRFRAEAFLADRKSDIYSEDDSIESIENAFANFQVEGDLDDFTIGYAPEGFEVDTRICIERLVQFAKENNLEPDM